MSFVAKNINDKILTVARTQRIDMRTGITRYGYEGLVISITKIYI